MKQINHFIRNGAVGLLSTVMLASCGDFLEITPRDIVTEDNFWNEKADVEQMVTGCYTAMQAQDFISRCVVWGDMRGDDIDGAPGVTGNNDLYQALINNLLPSNSYTSWAAFYYVINKCNNIIHMAPVVSEKDPAYRESDVRTTIAEVTALRSLCYWYLIRAFESVPFYRDAVSQEDEVLYLAPMGFDAVLNELIADLEAVKGDALEHYAISETDRVGLSYNSNCNRITRNGIRAMLCDMYLWRGDYDKAIQCVNEILDAKKRDYADPSLTVSTLRPFTGKYGTVTTYLYSNAITNDETGINRSYNAIFGGNGNSFESLLELSFNYTGEGSSYMMNTALGRLYGAGINKEIDGLKPEDTGRLRVLGSVVGDGAKTDASKWTVYRGRNDIRYYCSMRVADNQYGEAIISKGVANTFKVGTGSPYVNYNASNFSVLTVMNRNWIFYRLTDVLLMGAEAYIMKSADDDTENLQKAFDLIDVVNQRSVLLAADQLNRTPTTNRSTLKEMVRRERRAELMFEGKRWFDIIRYCRQDGNLDVAKAVPAKFNSILSSNPYPSMEHLFWPYSRDEVKKNPELKQKGIYDKESESFELNK